MNHIKFMSWMSALSLLVGVAAGYLPAQAAASEQASVAMHAGTSYQNDTSLPLYYLPAWNGEKPEEHEGPENPKLPNHHVDSVDPVIQHTMSPTTAMPPPILSFNGMDDTLCQCAPPDPNGAVGETQYVQMTNSGYQVFDKVTGASVLGPQATSTVWAGFGGVCETGGNGDPIVMYDQLAKRWIITQFASNGSGPITDECLAVSTTSDATAAYNRYGFHLGSSFYDYPHLGMWPDGYYMAMNVFNASGTAFLGPQPFAFDRAAMLAGTPATYVTTAAPLGGNEDPFLPASLDGQSPPAFGAPNPFVEYPGTGTYKVYRFHADFTTPANSSFTLVAGSPAAAGYSTLCGSSRACVPQIGSGDNLDGIGDRLMHRLAYRNFGDHESLVGNFSVSASNVAGIRWFELRSATAGTPTVFQEGTYQPDTTWRWMGSVAMDFVGNIALGYSASNATIHPQLRYAGRLAGDPLGTLTLTETHLFDGGGSQTGSGNRWGDYSALTVDPVDDCTFWYTQEYYAVTGGFSWNTRIGNFKIPNCAQTPGFTLAATPQDVSVCAGSPATLTINVGSTSDFNHAVTLTATGNPSPSSVAFAPNPVSTLPGSSAMTVNNTGGVASGVYPIQVSGSATGASNQTTTANLSVFSAAPTAAMPTTPENAAINQPLRPVFTWTGSNTESYTIDIATDAAFSDIVVSDTSTGTTYTPTVDLLSNTRYFWRVTAANACGSATTSTVFSFTTMPLPGDCSAGTSPTSVYSYGFEDGLNGWTLGAGSIGNTWADNTATPHTGLHSWKAIDSAAVSDQRFVSPAIVLPSGQLPLTLQFYNKRDIEASGTSACYDGAILEVSTDVGSTWTQVSSADLLTDPYTGPVDTTFGNPLAGLQAWCGVQDWTNSIVDISNYGGQTVQFRYRLGSDQSVGHDGLYLDDVKVQSCESSGTTHTVTPSVGTPSGTISPSTPVTVNDGATTTFTLTPNSGFQIASVGGTCGGLLSGNVYTTSAVTADCTVIANFADVTQNYTVGGTVNGLSGTGLKLALNGTETLPVATNGGFTFTSMLADGSAYSVTIATQPTGPAQVCTVANGSGTIAGANVTNVVVTCAADDAIFKDGFDGTQP